MKSSTNGEKLELKVLREDGTLATFNLTDLAHLIFENWRKAVYDAGESMAVWRNTEVELSVNGVMLLPQETAIRDKLRSYFRELNKERLRILCLRQKAELDQLAKELGLE